MIWTEGNLMMREGTDWRKGLGKRRCFGGNLKGREENFGGKLLERRYRLEESSGWEEEEIGRKFKVEGGFRGNFRRKEEIF